MMGASWLNSEQRKGIQVMELLYSDKFKWTDGLPKRDFCGTDIIKKNICEPKNTVWMD